MKHKDFTGILPAQTTGKEIEAEASIDLQDKLGAIIFFSEVRNRLREVNQWHKTPGFVSGKFQLTDANGKELNKHAEKGDFIKVDVPGPGSKEGEGYDWTIIEEMKEVNEADVQCFAMRVRPAHNPATNSPHVAHFYDDGGTSNFIVTREGNTVTVSIVDRNVKANDKTESLLDNIRHIAVGLGAMGAFSKAQWQNLAEGLVRNEE